MRVPGFSARPAWLGLVALAIVVMIGCLLNAREVFAEAPNYPMNSRDPGGSVGPEGCVDLPIVKTGKARVDHGICVEKGSIHPKGASLLGRQDTKARLWSKADEPIFRWRKSFIENEFQNDERPGPMADTRPTFFVPCLTNLLRKISFEGNADNDYVIGVKFSFKGFDWMNSFGSLLISVGDSLTRNGRSRPSSHYYLDIPKL